VKSCATIAVPLRAYARASKCGWLSHKKRSQIIPLVAMLLLSESVDQHRYEERFSPLPASKTMLQLYQNRNAASR